MFSGSISEKTCRNRSGGNMQFSYNGNAWICHTKNNTEHL